MFIKFQLDEQHFNCIFSQGPEEMQLNGPDDSSLNHQDLYITCQLRRMDSTHRANGWVRIQQWRLESKLVDFDLDTLNATILSALE